MFIRVQTISRAMTNILEQLNQQTSQNSGLKLPPPIALLMEVEFVSYEEGESMTNRFPVKESYQNPAGHMQGGMIAAAVDNTVGPLSFLLAPYSTTTHLNLTYIRPVTLSSPTPAHKYPDASARRWPR